MSYARILCLFWVLLFSNTIKAADISVCFSPYDPCAQKLIDFISSAKYSLDIAIYSITHHGITDAILAKSKEIPVRVIVDKGQSSGNSSEVKTLVENGIKVRYGVQKGIMHNKYTIVDNKYLETGSFNYSNGATDSNHENQIYLKDQDIVSQFQNNFEDIWSKAKAI